MTTQHSKLFTIITGLVYPAFLGAWIYNISESVFELIEGNASILAVQVALMGSLMLLYVADYAFTFDETLGRYGAPQFLLDMVILICLFGCLMYSADEEFARHLLKLWILLAIAKVIAATWDFVEKDWIGLRMDGPFAAIYGVGAFFFSSYPWALVACCFLDAAFYLVYSIFRRRGLQESKKCG